MILIIFTKITANYENQLNQFPQLLTMYNPKIAKKQYLPNTKQAGEALELLSSLESNWVSLVFLDPQYEKVSAVLDVNYPLVYTTDYQILRILEQIERVLKPSAFCLL